MSARSLCCWAAALLLVLASAAEAQETCSFQEGNYYSYDDVVQCFYSIPLTRDVKLQTIQTLRKHIESYAFLDIAQDSPDPNLPMKINIIEGLQTIQSLPYDFDFDFQNDLRALYDQLNDAHTQYYLPTCYQNILTRQPLALVGYGNTTSNFKVIVSPYYPDDLIDYYLNRGVNLTEYSGMQVLAVDGIPPLDFFLEYANNSVGMSKDLGTRFNFALTVPEPRAPVLEPLVQYGYWQQREHRNPFPKQPHVTYTLQDAEGNSVSVNLDWNFQAQASYADRDAFLQDYYFQESPDQTAEWKAILDDFNSYWKQGVHQQTSSTYKRRPARSQNFMPMERDGKAATHAREFLKQHLERSVDPVSGERLYDDSDTFELLVNTTHLQFWQLSDNITMVMYLDSMEPDADGPSGFYHGLKEGFDAAASRGLTRLIIDLTNNGGGNICLGRTLLAFFQQSGWNGQGQNWGPTDIPLSAMARKCINASVELGVSTTIWSPSYYSNQEGEPIANNDTSYLLPGLPHERGNRLRRYSKLIHLDNCGEFGYFIEPAVNFSPNQVMILTKGLCGSTCALFSNHMALYDDITTVAIGGYPSQTSMQYTSFPGIQVVDNQPFFSMLAELRMNITTADPDDQEAIEDPIPRLLPTQAGFRSCVREIYPPTNPTYGASPTEFSYQQADYHIFNDEVTAVYPQYNWYKVLEYFP